MPFIFLVGFFGSGKSSVGHELARLLGCPFYDTDRLVEKMAGCSIEQIFRQEGEGAFRRLEWEALCALSGQEPGVVATGGAIFLSRPHRQLLFRLGVSVWLDAPLAEIRKRLAAAGATFRFRGRRHLEELYSRRRSSYALADFHLKTEGKSIPQIASEAASVIVRKRTSASPAR